MSDVVVPIKVQDGASGSLNTIKGSTDALNTSAATLAQTFKAVGAASAESGAQQAALAAATEQAAKSNTEAGKAATETATATKDQAKATKEAAEAQAGFLGSLRPILSASKEYAESVSRATMGTTGWLQQAGHLGAALDGMASGGLTAVVAGADLASMAFTAAAAAGHKVYDIAVQFANAADEMADNAAIVGTTTEKFSQLDSAIKMMGEDPGRIRQGMTRLTMNIKEAAETTGVLTGKLGDMGISLFDAKGNIKDTGDLFLDFAKGLAEVPEGFERAQAAQEVLGRGGAALIPVLGAVTGSLREQAATAKAIGATYNELDGEIADAFLSATGKLSVFASAVSNSLGRVVTPVVTKVIDLFADLGTNVMLKFADSMDAVEVRGAQFLKLFTPETFQEYSKSITEANERLHDQTTEIEKLIEQRERLKTLEGRSQYSGTQDDAPGFDAQPQNLNVQTIASIDEEIKAQAKLRDAKLDTLAAQQEQLTATRAALLLSRSQSAATLTQISQIDQLLTQIKDEIELKGGLTEAYKKHTEETKKSAEAAREELEAKNLAGAASEYNKNLLRELFEVKKQMAAHDRKAGGDETQDEIARNQVLLSRLKAEEALYQKRLALQLDMANESIKIEEGIVDADRGEFEAKVALFVAYATMRQQTMIGIYNSHKSVVDAIVALEVQRATRDDELAKTRIKLESEIFAAETNRIANVQNADLRAERAVQQEREKTAKMREDAGNRQLLQSERIAQRELQIADELAGKLEATDDIRARIANSTLIALEAHRDLENEIANAALGVIQNATKADILFKEGADLIADQAAQAQATADRLGLTVDVSAALNGQLMGCGAAVASCASGAASFTAGLSSAAGQAGALVGNLKAAASSLTQIQAGQQMGNAAGGDMVNGQWIPYPQQGLMGLPGMEAVQHYQTNLFSAKENEKQQAANKALQEQVDKANAAANARLSPSQKAAKDAQDQIKAKQDQLNGLAASAGYNAQLDALDLQIQNTRMQQTNSYAGSLAGLRNQSDLLSQSQAVLEAQRRLANSGALAGGTSQMDAISQSQAIAEAIRKNSNYASLAGGQNQLDVLAAQAGVLDQGRQVGNYGAMTPILNTADTISSVLKELETRRKDAASGLPKFAGGTGLSGVPGLGRNDSVLSLLTPGEIVVPFAESEELRARSRGSPIAIDRDAQRARALASLGVIGTANGGGGGSAASYSKEGPEPAYSGGGTVTATRYTKADVEVIATAIALAMRKNMGAGSGPVATTITVDSRVLGQVMVDQTRKGQRTTSLSGSTNRGYL